MSDSEYDSDEEGVYVPPEVLYEIYTFMDHKEICKGMLVSKDFYGALQNDHLWFSLALRKWNFVKLRAPFKTWKEYFVRNMSIGKRWESGRSNVDYKVKSLRGDKTRFGGHIEDIETKGKYILLKDVSHSVKVWKENDSDNDFQCVFEREYKEFIPDDGSYGTVRVAMDQSREKRVLFAVSYLRKADNEEDPYFLDDDYFDKKHIVELWDLEANEIMARVKTNKTILGIGFCYPCVTLAVEGDQLEVHYVNGTKSKLSQTMDTTAMGQNKVHVKTMKTTGTNEYMCICHTPTMHNVQPLQAWKFNKTKNKSLISINNCSMYAIKKRLGIIFCVKNDLRTVETYKLGKPEVLYTFNRSNATITCIYSQGSRKVVLGEQDGSIEMFACNAKTCQKLWENKSHNAPINAVEFDAIKLCAASADNTISVHDVKNKGKKFYVLLGGSRRIRSGEVQHPTKQFIYDIRITRSSVVSCIKNMIRVYCFD